MPLFTFVLDYAGGTYVSQRSSAGVKQAFAEWVQALVLEDIALGASLDVAAAFADWEDENPVALDGLTNAWCVTGGNEAGMALVNIIQTET